MNNPNRIASYGYAPDPLTNQLDALLADIAINVQLPPGLYAKACGRKTKVQEFLEREGSPLPWPIVRFYPQGSMAIDATISTRGTDDEYDLDLVAELLVPPGTAPGHVLHMLWLALKDYPLARVSRQTRCITIHYADGMHLDVTPSRRVPYTKDFGSVIFHAKREESPIHHTEVAMNAYAFASWFNSRTPIEESFSVAYNHRLLKAYDAVVADEAIVHEVPEQTPLPRKSVTTVGLQLIKRFRNIWSNTREERYPPSVMLSCHAGHAALSGISLTDMVIRQARWTARAIDNAEAKRRLLDVRNPEMQEDCFTDRWPENCGQQRAFGQALHGLAGGLEQVHHGNLLLEELQEWLRRCFGSHVVSRSVRALNARNGDALRTSAQGYSRNGGLFVPAAPAIIGSGRPLPSIVTPRPHTNMGERRR